MVRVRQSIMLARPVAECPRQPECMEPPLWRMRPLVGASHGSWRSRAAEPSSGYLQAAASTLGGEHEVDPASELVGNEIADHTCPVTASGGWRHRRTASFTPLEQGAL